MDTRPPLLPSHTQSPTVQVKKFRIPTCAPNPLSHFGGGGVPSILKIVKVLGAEHKFHFGGFRPQQFCSKVWCFMHPRYRGILSPSHLNFANIVTSGVWFVLYRLGVCIRENKFYCVCEMARERTSTSFPNISLNNDCYICHICQLHVAWPFIQTPFMLQKVISAGKRLQGSTNQQICSSSVKFCCSDQEQAVEEIRGMSSLFRAKVHEEAV